MKKFTLLALLIAAVSTYGQDTKIRFFGQPDFIYQQTADKDPIANKTTNSTSSNFNGGGFVIFVTSQINDRVSVLAESDAHYNAGDKRFNFEVERLFVRYYHKDYLSFRVGRMYTPIGYWNNQYNLGLVLQPTIIRPFQIRAAHDGGVIQTRDIGFQVEGENISSLRLFYQVMFANGVGYYGDNDKGNNHIAISGKIGIEPIDGLKFLVSGQKDFIKKGFVSPTGLVQIDNGNLWVANASIVHMNSDKKFEFIGEYYHQFNVFDSLGTRQSIGYFAYSGYKVTNKLIPYVVFNHSLGGLNNTPDPYFSNAPIDLKTANLGVRYKFNSSLVLKFEYEYQIQTVKNVPTPIGVKDFTTENHRAKLQFAFAF